MNTTQPFPSRTKSVQKNSRLFFWLAGWLAVNWNASNDTVRCLWAHASAHDTMRNIQALCVTSGRYWCLPVACDEKFGKEFGLGVGGWAAAHQPMFDLDTPEVFFRFD